MGGGASSHGAFEQMLACTMILGEAMVQGLDPRYVRFPDMYRLYDFHIGPKKHKQRSFQGGNLVLFVHSPDDSSGGGGLQQIQLLGDDNDANSDDSSDKDGTLPESDDEHLVVYVSGDKMVLDRATLSVPNNDGWTPLHSCCHTLNSQEAGIAILKELVATKADLNMVTKRGPGSFSFGWTPLHISVAYGLEALALKLIRAGADVNTKNSVGWSPLYDACHRGYATVARELLKAGAKHDIICPEFALCPFPGQFALAEAARQGHTETVKVLLEWGADKNAVNKLGWTALHEAAYHSRVAIVQMLIVYGADVMIKTLKGSLARDLTISSEIKAMLEDVSQHTSTPSPKKPPVEDVQEAGEKEETPPKKSPTRKSVAHSGPISRKEEYALLGDLPALTPPAISIRDANDEDVEAKDTAGEGKDDDDSCNNNDEDGKKKKHKRRGKKRDKGNIPPEFKCAISLKLMKDPMRSPYGQVFDRAAIEAWFRDFGNRCPLTGEPLTMTQLVPDEKLKEEIREWKHGSQKGASEDGAAILTATAKPSLTVEPTNPQDDPYDF
ncbi:TPA: hypothetical protein N0F65_012499 [Lagenidium giganteum]|uniref:U-box domain-containing protein n=1 Tax=Lagenidium giganteum TaxID=4803 RepID=A0AAV2YST6_9STRA|nr:TPA: hypothetical protein N0F65_012499 [Lagenidium giganteum]